jgi:hypothetical protein
MSRRSVISSQRVNDTFQAVSNPNEGVVLKCAVIDICGAHNPTTPFIAIELDDDGSPLEGFFSSGIRFVLYDIGNKEIISTPWKGTYDELRTVYGNDENIKGRRVDLHCASDTRNAIETSLLVWEREHDILFQDASTGGYISLAGTAGITVNDYESQMNAFAAPGVGKGRRWNRL